MPPREKNRRMHGPALVIVGMSGDKLDHYVKTDKIWNNVHNAHAWEGYLTSLSECWERHLRRPELET